MPELLLPSTSETFPMFTREVLVANGSYNDAEINELTELKSSRTTFLGGEIEVTYCAFFGDVDVKENNIRVLSAKDIQRDASVYGEYIDDLLNFASIQRGRDSAKKVFKLIFDNILRSK
jgi:hypothetical protein